MRKIIAAMNMSVDGNCDHTAGIADDELHQHYTGLLRSAGAILYGRITYQLMESHWPAIVKNPTGNTTTDEFAVAIQEVPKIVFSHTLKNTDPVITGWENTTLAGSGLEEEVKALRQQAGKDIFVGSPGLIAALTKLNLIDEFQLCVHPVIAGSGLPLFKNITDRIALKLLRTKTLGSGIVLSYYEPAEK
ncbi:MAG: dihydrofolate reductase family protein [Chitinophagaceae bacterium]